MIKLSDLPKELQMAIIYHEIDLDDINEAIERYEPTVAMIEERFQNEGYSVLLMDLNCGICPLWMDFYMRGDILQTAWNGIVFNLKSQPDVERYLFRFDERVRMMAWEAAGDYLLNNGIVIEVEDGEYRLVQGFGNRKIRSIGWSPTSSAETVSTAKKKTVWKPRGVSR